MARKKTVVWYGLTYDVQAVEDVVDNEGKACCPHCHDGALVEHAPNLVQFGLFEDVYFEFCECDRCSYNVMIRSKIVLEGGIPFETMLDVFIQSQPDYIPF